MDYSAPINNAIQLLQRSPVVHYLGDLNKRSTKSERIFIGVASFITFYNLVSYIKEKRQKLHAPPTVPFGIPFIGHMPYLMFMPNKFIDWCNKKYGEVYNIKNFGSIVTVVSGSSAREVLKADSSDLSMEEGTVKDNLHLHYMFDFEAILLSRDVTPVIAKSVIPLAKMPMYIPGIQQGLETGIKANFNQDGPTILEKPSPFFQNLVAYMSVPSLLGDEFHNNIPVIKSFAEFTYDIIRNVMYWKLIPKVFHPWLIPYMQSVEKHRQVLFDYVIPVVHKRREKMRQAEIAGEDHGLEENFLTALIEYVLYTDENGQPVRYTDDQIVDGILSVAFASVHTSSMNMSFCLYWLLARPDLKEKLLEEIEQVMPGNTPVNGEGLAQMKFMNNFVREALRQGVNIVGSGKKVMKDYTFANGYQIPKDRMVQTASRQLNFGDNTTRSLIEDMDPDMSMNKLATTPAKDFVTFGAGKHLCPGRFFAVQEIEMCLIYLLKNFDVQTFSGHKPVPYQAVAGVFLKNCEDPLIFTPKKVLTR